MRPRSLHRILDELLQRLKRHDRYGFFLEPVPQSTPDYFNVVNEPMDFSTMQTKLDQHHYTTLAIFQHDFELIITNCMTFNPPQSVYHQEAARLGAYGAKTFERVARIPLKPVKNDNDKTGEERQTATSAKSTPCISPAQPIRVAMSNHAHTEAVAASSTRSCKTSNLRRRTSSSNNSLNNAFTEPQISSAETSASLTVPSSPCTHTSYHMDSDHDESESRRRHSSLLLSTPYTTKSTTTLTPRTKTKTPKTPKWARPRSKPGEELLT